MPPILLNADLGIETAADLQRQLMPSLHQVQPVLLDASRVQRLHTAGLQVVCALFMSRQRAGLETRWTAVSDILRDAANHLGLAAIFELADTCNSGATVMETST